MRCTTTEPGHATNLTGVKYGLALAHDRWRAPVDVRVVAVDGERITIALTEGTLEARCHDAERLARLLEESAASGAQQPRVQFTPHEHQLFVEVEPGVLGRVGGTEYLAPSSSTGAYAAFNVALPWHPTVPCGHGVRNGLIVA